VPHQLIAPIVLALALAGSAPATSSGQTPAAHPAPGARPYLIGPEDILDISVWDNASVSRVVPVRPDGKISLPLVSDIQAAGLTPLELRDAIRRSLVTYIPASEVSVVVREVHSLKVSVLGEVNLPGRYEVKSVSTVLDAIALAGGFNAFASRDRLLIIRQSGGATERITFDYTKFVKHGKGGQAPPLWPGDLVIVP